MLPGGVSFAEVCATVWADNPSSPSRHGPLIIPIG